MSGARPGWSTRSPRARIEDGRVLCARHVLPGGEIAGVARLPYTDRAAVPPVGRSLVDDLGPAGALT